MRNPRVILFQKLTLAILGIVVLSLGIISIADPVSFIRPFGIELNGMAGTNEIRAQYGGFLILLGLFLFRGIIVRTALKQTLILGVFFMGGINLGRLTDWLVHQKSIFEGLTDIHQFFMLVMDPAGFLFALIAYLLTLNQTEK